MAKDKLVIDERHNGDTAMTKTQKYFVAYAMALIAKELAEGRAVKIPGFGKLYISKVPVRKGVHPMADDWGGTVTETKTVRFRPFEKLKAQLNPTKEQHEQVHPDL